jgi:hypothetical protein
MIDDGRVKREDALDSDAETHLAHCDALTCSAMLAGDDDTFENLETFFIAFLNSNVNLYGVTRLERRDILS